MTHSLLSRPRWPISHRRIAQSAPAASAWSVLPHCLCSNSLSSLLIWKEPILWQLLITNLAIRSLARGNILGRTRCLLRQISTKEVSFCFRLSRTRKRNLMVAKMFSWLNHRYCITLCSYYIIQLNLIKTNWVVAYQNAAIVDKNVEFLKKKNCLGFPISLFS